MRFVEQKVDVAKGFGIDEDVARRLASKYGSNVDELFNIEKHLNTMIARSCH